MKVFFHLLFVAGLVVFGAIGWMLAFPDSRLTAGLLDPSPRAAASGAQARVLYQYTDAQGAVRIVESLEEVPAERRADAGRIEVPLAPVQPANGRDSAEPSIVVYTTSWCGYCRKTIADLEARGLRYTNLDIERDPAARDALLELVGSTAVPVTVFDGEVIRGYDPARLAKLADRR